MLLCFGVESLNERGLGPFLLDNEDCGWNDVVGFFINGDGGGCFERLVFNGLDLLRKVVDGREKSVSSKLSESDFDAIDNELALLRSK